jgi:hypothetical protein
MSGGPENTAPVLVSIALVQGATHDPNKSIYLSVSRAWHTSVTGEH